MKSSKDEYDYSQYLNNNNNSSSTKSEVSISSKRYENGENKYLNSPFLFG